MSCCSSRGSRGSVRAFTPLLPVYGTRLGVGLPSPPCIIAPRKPIRTAHFTGCGPPCDRARIVPRRVPESAGVGSAVEGSSLPRGARAVRRSRTPRIVRIGTGIIVVVAALAAGVASAQAPGSTVDRVRLDGVVDPFIANHIQASIDDATTRGDAAVLLVIDTPGGLESSMREISQAILNAGIPVICYVSPLGARAASAGAFVLLSCPIAAMAPG